MKTLFHNKALLLLIVLLLPLLFINVKDTHDWGDDFAQYLIQARNILEHRPQTENGLVFTEYTGQFAVKAYPVGFPLLLASIWKVFGYSISNFELLISVCMIVFGVITFFLLKHYVPEWVALIFTLAIFYNPVLLDFKKQVLSDIPFALFFMAAVLSAISNRKRPLLTGVLIGFAASIRGVGICLMVLPLLMLFDKSRKPAIAVLISSTVVFLLLNTILFSTASSDFFQFYKNTFSFSGLMEQVSVNATYYYEVLKYFFNQGEGFLQKLSSITKYVFVLSFAIGLIYSTISRKSLLIGALLIIYILILLFYPYRAGGFRFLIPVIVLILVYSLSALQNVFRLRGNWLIPLGLLLLIQNYDGIRRVVKAQNNVEHGPQEPVAAATFSYIQHKLKSTDIVAFVKSRALSFYASVPTAYVAYNVTAEQAKMAFDQMNYFLIAPDDPDLKDDKLQHYISSENLALEWENASFKLYSHK